MWERWCWGGCSAEVQKALVSSEPFDRFMLGVWHDVKRHMDKGRRSVTVAFYCNKGRHRSVACAEMLQHVGEAAGLQACSD